MESSRWNSARWIFFSNFLLICLACLVVAIIYKAWINEQDISIVLTLAGLVIGGLTLISIYIVINRGRRILLSIILNLIAIAVLAFLQPGECQFNVQLFDDLVENVHAGKNKFLEEKEMQLQKMDSLQVDGTLRIFFDTLIAGQLAAKEIKRNCYKLYQKKLEAWSNKEITACVNKKELQIRLRNDINRVIDQQNGALIRPLFYDYNIDSIATAYQYYERSHSTLYAGNLKLLLEGVILNGDKVRLKRITHIETNSADQKITKIIFVNELAENL